jgi:hypothetical protein
MWQLTWRPTFLAYCASHEPVSCRAINPSLLVCLHTGAPWTCTSKREYTPRHDPWCASSPESTSAREAAGSVGSVEELFLILISVGLGGLGGGAFSHMIDRPFIVLAETKPSKRHIPVWARYSPLRTRVEAHAIRSHHDLAGILVTPYS